MLKGKRDSNIELLRIVCTLMIISSHFLGIGHVSNKESLGFFFLFNMLSNLSRVACSVFVIISAWYSIDKPFNIARAFHVWITTVMLCLPMVIFGYHQKLFVDDISLIKASLLPVSYGYGGMWFPSVYIILLLISPFLSHIINNMKREILKAALVSYICIFSLFATVFHENGKYQLELVAFVFLYIMTGYMRKYWISEEKIPGKLASCVGFLISWMFITALMAWGGYNAGNIIADEVYNYGSFFYGYFQTVPNLICSFSLFFFFYRFKMKRNAIVNWLAVSSFGIIIFHNVPEWNSYLYTTLLHSTWHARHLQGWKVVIYGISGIILIYMVGLAIETVRRNVSRVLVEDRKWYRIICNTINDYYNGEKSIDTKRALLIMVPFFCYYGMVHFVFWFKENGFSEFIRWCIIIGIMAIGVSVIALLKDIGYQAFGGNTTEEEKGDEK